MDVTSARIAIDRHVYFVAWPVLPLHALAEGRGYLLPPAAVIGRLGFAVDQRIPWLEVRHSLLPSEQRAMRKAFPSRRCPITFSLVRFPFSSSSYSTSTPSPSFQNSRALLRSLRVVPANSST